MNPFFVASKMKLQQSKVYIISTRISNYIVYNIRPYSTLHIRPLRALIYECKHRYTFRSKATFSENIIFKTSDYSNSCHGELHTAGAAAWTTDRWTSRATSYDNNNVSMKDL